VSRFQWESVRFPWDPQDIFPGHAAALCECFNDAFFDVQLTGKAVEGGVRVYPSIVSSASS
jgi:hypothetical protein